MDVAKYFIFVISTFRALSITYCAVMLQVEGEGTLSSQNVDSECAVWIERSTIWITISLQVLVFDYLITSLWQHSRLLNGVASVSTKLLSENNINCWRFIWHLIGYIALSDYYYQIRSHYHSWALKLIDQLLSHQHENKNS